MDVLVRYTGPEETGDGSARLTLDSPHNRNALSRQLVTELLMAGERLGAQRLHDLGVVNRLCDAGQALTTALAWAEQLADRAPNVLTSIKELVGEAGQQSLHEHLAMERDHFVRNLHHANGGIGIAAFLAKEKPRYK